MRLSGLVVASILLVSATLLAQHSSGAGGSSSGASHSSYSGGSNASVSSASSHNSSGSASHVASTGAGTSHPSPSTKLSSTKENAAPEKKSSRSFLHPFRKPKPVQSAEFKRPAPCLKGPCAVCPPGESRSGKGACMVASNVCSPGQSWNGFACGLPYRFNDCGALADQLAAQQRQMRGQSDAGQVLVYRLLRQQYESCLARPGSRSYGSASLFDTLLDTP